MYSQSPTQSLIFQYFFNNFCVTKDAYDYFIIAQ